MEDSNNEEEEEIGRETRERWREMLRAVETPEALHPNSYCYFQNWRRGGPNTPKSSL